MLLRSPELPRASQTSIDRATLELERALGSSHVLRDRDAMAEYARDESEVEPSMPDMVVLASSKQAIVDTLTIAAKHDIYVTPRAGGSGRTGGAIPSGGGIVLATHGMSRVKDINHRDLVAVVEPGILTWNLHNEVEREGLFYPPDPNSLKMCRLGGNIAENAGGPRAFKYGVTREYIYGLETVLMGGTVIRSGRQTVKGVTGYDVTALLVGSEGTLGVFTEATVRLLRRPPEVATLVATYTSEAGAVEVVEALIQRGVVPRCVELMDEATLVALRNEKVPVDLRAKAMLLLEVDGFGPHFEEEIESLGNQLSSPASLDVQMAKNEADRERLWSARRALSPATKKLAKHKLSEDVVVPRSRMLDLFAFMQQMSEENLAATKPEEGLGVRHLTYGHAGDGNLHVNFLWDTQEQRSHVNRSIDRLMHEVVRLGGTISGEHGIGITKLEYLGIEQSPDLILLQQRIKQAFDPRGLLNPGKMFPASRAAGRHNAC